MKESVIEYIDYNLLISLLDYFTEFFNNKQVHGKNLNIVQSYSDNHNAYESPSMSIELLHRKNRSIGFGGGFVYDSYEEDNIFEFEGALLEYRVQINVYSNTRGEIHKWCSIIDDALKNGERGISVNTYQDNGDLKESNMAVIKFDYDNDVKNNNMQPNVMTYDFHSIYEVKMDLIQLFRLTFSYAELGNIIGKLK
jgi:hypothetical protein